MVEYCNLCQICRTYKDASDCKRSGMCYCCKECLKKYDVIPCYFCREWERREKMVVVANHTICYSCRNKRSS